MRNTFILLLFSIHLYQAQAQENANSAFVKNQIQQLNVALKYYTAIERSQNWKYIKLPADSIKFGTKLPRVKEILRNNLCLAGDLPEDVITINSPEEDSAIYHSLKYFQYRFGLPQTGELNQETLTAINTPICDRIDQIRTNIKRWKDFLLSDENLFVLVNIPDYSIQVIKNGKVELKLNAIVGKPTTPTALFYDQIEQLVINPSWVVPSNIIKLELFDKIKNNPQYLSQHHFKIFAYTKKGKKYIPPEEIDWPTVTVSSFNYSIEQTPGPWNALGKIKFLFPNNNAIYLHDTPEKELFKKYRRAFSHGCIRVENPIHLAEYLLKETTNISKATLHSKLNKVETTIISLSNPTPIALAYFTCFADEDNAIHFRKDIYQLDVFEEEELELLGKL